LDTAKTRHGLCQRRQKISVLVEIVFVDMDADDTPERNMRWHFIFALAQPDNPIDPALEAYGRSRDTRRLDLEAGRFFEAGEFEFVFAAR
jgi:hypothetical protein